MIVAGEAKQVDSDAIVPIRRNRNRRNNAAGIDSVFRHARNKTELGELIIARPTRPQYPGDAPLIRACEVNNSITRSFT